MEDLGMHGREVGAEEVATRWLSEARLETYLQPCGGDLHLAMHLYDWNLRLAQAVLHDVALFEVSLRNAYDQCLRNGWGEEWLSDDSSPVRRPIMRTNRRGYSRDQNRFNRRAIDSLASVGRSHDWVVSNLTLGFWTHMTDRSHERDLWIPYLHRAWLAGTDRAAAARGVGAVNAVRNRAMHHERLFNPSNGGISVNAAAACMEEAFEHLVPAEFRDEFPDLRPCETLAFIEDVPAPADVLL
jgi:hypothetical protein